MNTTNERRSASERQVNAYVESWQSDHHEAMKCADWEDIIAVGTSVYNLLRGQDKFQREMIFRGAGGYSVAESLILRHCLNSWLVTTQSVLTTQIIPLERDYTVNGAGELRAQASEAAEYLADWTEPTVSAAVGLRELEFDDEAATEFDRVMAEAEVSPTPMPSGPQMQEVSLAEFRSRSESK